MKLKKLLKVIPDEYKIGIADFNEDSSIVSYDTKEDAVKSLAIKTTTTPDYVNNLEVVTVTPCARVYCTDEHVFCDDMPPLHVEPQLYIEVRSKWK